MEQFERLRTNFQYARSRPEQIREDGTKRHRDACVECSLLSLVATILDRDGFCDLAEEYHRKADGVAGDSDSRSDPDQYKGGR